MININNKEWNKLTVEDIKTVIETAEESFYYEFKDDRVETKKIAEEISALANTYGGYIFIGISDNKQIGGCTNWNEQKIHVMIHDALSPTPDFDVKKFVTEDDKAVFVIKVEEGTMPPYMTSRGKIYERLSSGSFEIKDSAKLTQMYYKRESKLKQIEEKLTIPPIETEDRNIFGYIDIGFHLKTTNAEALFDKYKNADIKKLSFRMREEVHSIARVGFSLMISVGKITNTKGYVKANLHNFIQIMHDGSVKLRILLTNNEGVGRVNIASILATLLIFRDIYFEIFGKDFEQIFLSAGKYEELTVLKQFSPVFEYEGEECAEENQKWKKKYNEHISNYGNNIIIASDRFPKYGLKIMDKRYFERIEVPFSSYEIIDELFSCIYSFLGYVDIEFEE